MMAEIVRLADYKIQGLLGKGFSLWRRQFKERFDAHTRLKDLSAPTLCQLAEPGDESTALLYGMITGFMGFEEPVLEGLDALHQGLVIDIHFFLADHIRFEMMTRLGWLAPSTADQLPLFEMVDNWEVAKAAGQQNPPRLSASHPEYATYQGLMDRDQQILIRRMLPDALDAFKKANDL